MCVCDGMNFRPTYLCCECVPKPQQGPKLRLPLCTVEGGGGGGGKAHGLQR